MRSALSLVVIQIFFLLSLPAGRAQQLFFQHYRSGQGLKAQIVTSVEWTGKGLVVGTNKGLFTLAGHRFKALYKSEEHYITRIGKTSDGRIWVADEFGRMFVLGKNGLRDLPLKTEFRQLIARSIVDQVEADGKTWYISLVIGGGIYTADESRVERLGDTLVRTRYVAMELPGNGMISGVYDESLENDALTILFNDGKRMEVILSESSPQNKSMVRKLSDNRFIYSRGREIIVFSRHGVVERKFFHANIEDVMIDTEGKIWIGFAEGGLHCFPTGELSSNNFSRYLGHTTVSDMAMDGDGDIWFATSQGLYSLPKMKEAKYSPPVFVDQNRRERSPKELGVKDSSHAREGMAVLPEPAPRAVISSVRINRKDTALHEIYQLNARQNLLEFEFAGLVGNRPEAVQFKYKLVGTDTSWNYATFNKATYQGLAPGTYTFYVYAQNKQGRWSEYPGSVAFIISPPFYRTKTFYLLAGIGFCFLGVLVFLLFEQVKRRSRMREEEFKKRVLQSELQALRAQMNPHFTFNTLSSIQNYISRNDAENASKYLSKFAKLIRIIMENAKQTDVPLKDELHALNLYIELESLRLRDKFEYHIDVQKDIDQQYARIPSMLIQPYVENAIWHGITNKEGKGNLLVSVSRNGTSLKCTVEDDGIGREAAMKIAERKRKHISQGMSITGERLELMNSLNRSGLSVKITDKKNGDGNPAGTKVEIFIPLKDD